jgi:hypothetical protein
MPPTDRGPALPADVLDALADPAALMQPDVTAEARAWWHRHANPEHAGPANPVDPETQEVDDVQL